LVPLVVFFVLLVVFYFSWILISNQIKNDQQKKFDNQVDRIVDLMTEKSRDAGSTIYGEQGFFEGSSEVTPSEFQSYSRDLRLSDEFFCLSGLGYIEKTDSKNLPIVERDINAYFSASGQASSTIKVSPQEKKDTYYIIKYFYPYSSAISWLGRDYSSVSNQADVLKQAMDSGSIGQTPILKSPEDGSNRYDIVAPVYKSVFQPITIADRESKLMGYSFISFNPEECALIVDSSTLSNGISFNISDITEDANSSPFASVGDVSNNPNNFYSQRTIDFYGRQWLFKFSASNIYGLGNAEFLIINIFPPFGLILCFIISLIILSYSTSRSRAILLADEVTKDLKASEAKLDTLFNKAPDPIFVLDDDGRFVDMNNAGAAMHGISRDELIKNHKIFDFISSRDKTTDLNLWKKFLNEGKIRFDFVFEGPISKQARYMEITGSAHFLPGLNLAIIRDVTHHREVEMALKQNSETMSAMLNATMDAVYFVKTDGTFIVVNISGAKRLNKKPEEIVGTVMYDYYPGEVAQSRKEIVDEVVRTGKMIRFEDSRSGHYLFNSIYPIKDENGNVASLVIFVEDITDRKQAENALKESEEKYRQLFSNMRSGVAIYESVDNGKKFIFKDFNHAAEIIEGKKKEEVIGKDVTEVFPGSVKMGIVEIFKEVYKTGEPKYFPESLYANGHQSWRENYIYKLPNGNIVTIYNDVTEEVIRKNQLKESEERYRDLVNFSPDAIIVHTDKKIVFANPSAVKLFGAKKVDDFIGKSIFDLISSQSREVTEKRINQVLKENVGVPLIDEKFIKFDGTFVDVSVITAPLIYNGKKSIQVVINDISERKKFENQLEEANENLKKYKLAVDNTSDHVIITDSEGVIVYANKAAEKITGYKFEEMKGNTPRLWGGQMPLEFYKEMWKTIKYDKHSFVGEVTNRRKSGELYQAVMSISPILDDSGKLLYFVGIERDVTKERAIDKSKSEFVSLASHQLRTPLSAINWYTEMLLDEDVGKLNIKQKDYLGEIYHSSKRMADLVGSLLNVSRIELGTFAIEPKPTDITEILKSVVKELSHEIKKRHQKLVEQYDKKIGQLNIDQNLMRIVLQNLISNSVKYTPSKGSIKIEVHKIGNDVIISVADTGYGIPEHQQSRIFEKFFRADNIREVETDGTGLGLYIVKEIVEKSGGSIWFESKEGKGTKFYVSLPVVGMTKKVGTKKLI
jgi:PAS domain S-box-containing protein